MTLVSPQGVTIPGARHHLTEVGDARLHHVTAGESGSPVLLVHGFPETWRAFRGLIPLLAARHRVHAVDLRGFGDSDPAGPDFGSAAAAEDLHRLVGRLGTGPVHVLGQDLGGGVVHRLAATHPEDVASLTGVETALAGFGAERLADVTSGGVWYIGALVTAGVPELLLAGREAEFIAGHLYPSFGAVAPAVTDADTAEFVRGYARPGGFRGATGLYRSLLGDGAEIRALASTAPLRMPVLAVGAFGGSVTAAALEQVSAGPVAGTVLAGVGHYAAQEAPGRLAEVLLPFLAEVDGRPTAAGVGD
jgi:pimeloyl-ACP methyl ester carboxylesterase